LATIQRGAPLLPLKSLVAKHGWPNIVRYCLLDPGQFEQSFCSQAAQLRFCDILSFWHEAQKGLSQSVEGRSYPIPSPIQWKEKFDQETRIISCLEVADQYNKNDLVGLKIVSKKQQQAIEGAVREKNLFDETVTQLQRQFDMETIHERQAMDLAKKNANDNFNLHPAHVAISQITTLEQTEIARLQESNKRKIEKAEASFKQFKDQLIDQCQNALSPDDRLEIAQQRAASDLTIRQIRQKEVSEIEHIRFEMQERRKAEQKLLNAAKALLERSLQAIDEQFRQSTLPQRRKMDALLQGAEDRFHKKTAECDRVYRS
jgi:hypothetical protein